VPGSLNVESRVSLKAIQELSQKGHKVKVQSDWGTLSAPKVIVYDTKTGVAAGGADPRRSRYAVAW
jgi:gamma-glutamyltranspeptidase